MTSNLINNRALFEIIARAKKKRREWQWPEAVKRAVEEAQKEKIIPSDVRSRAAYFQATSRAIEREQVEVKEHRREAQIADARRVAIRDRRDHLLPEEDQEFGGEEFGPSASVRR